MKIKKESLCPILFDESDMFANTLRNLKADDSNVAFAKKINITEGTLRAYLNGKSLPGMSVLSSIANATGVTIEWLVTGREPKFRADVALFASGDATANAMDEDYSLVPQLDVRASAGHGTTPADHPEEIGKLAFRREWIRRKGLSDKNLYAITIHGDSMEPTLKNGAIALVDTRPVTQIKDGIYAMMLNDNLMVKRLELDLDGSVWVRSDNKAYREHHLTLEQSKTLNIIGKLFWVGGEI